MRDENFQTGNCGLNNGIDLPVILFYDLANGKLRNPNTKKEETP